MARVARGIRLLSSWLAYISSHSDSSCKALNQLHFSSNGCHSSGLRLMPSYGIDFHSKLNFPHSVSPSGRSCHTSGATVHSTSDIFSRQYKHIEVALVEQGIVGLIVLNRPEVLNALSEDLMHDLIDAFQELDTTQKVGAIVITGRGKAFAAGADIKEMKGKVSVDILMSPFPSRWNDVSKVKKPIIAAVNGYALGGGCELALMCDIILAGEKAVFGQPEIKLGTIPGMGGTQRMIREVGKSRAMEMILTGSLFLDAQEACQHGLASRMVAGTNDELVKEALSVAAKIAKQSRPAVVMAKAAVNSAYEMGLQEGIKKEQAFFGTTFALADQKEGMSAFIEKREAQFVHK